MTDVGILSLLSGSGALPISTIVGRGPSLRRVLGLDREGPPPRAAKLGSAAAPPPALRPRPSPLAHGRAALATRPRRMVEARRVIVQVEWHPGELHPRVGFIVTNLSLPAERGWPFYNKRSTAEQGTSLRASAGVISG